MSYWYLGSPYTRFPGGKDAAFRLAVDNLTLLLEAEVPTFSPIVHTHELAGEFPNADHDFWLNVVDGPMIEAAKGLIYLEADSWQDSQGLHEEIVRFTKAKKPIVFMQPGIVPAELRQIDLTATRLRIIKPAPSWNKEAATPPPPPPFDVGAALANLAGQARDPIDVTWSRPEPPFRLPSTNRGWDVVSD